MTIKKLLNLHKYIGIVSVVVIIMLVITGILLNHTQSLSLDQQNTSNKALNNWYGIKIPQAKKGFKNKNTWFSVVSQTLYINQNKVNHVKLESLKAVEKLPFGWLVVGKHKLVLLTDQAELIDIIKLDIEVVSTYSQRQNLILKLKDGVFYQLATPYENLTKIEYSAEDKETLLLSELPTKIKNEINQHLNQGGLTLERVILDIHSGRFFGKFGVYIIDFFSLLFLILSLTGFLIYLKQHKLRKNLKKR